MESETAYIRVNMLRCVANDDVPKHYKDVKPKKFGCVGFWKQRFSGMNRLAGGR